MTHGPRNRICRRICPRSTLSRGRRSQGGGLAAAQALRKETHGAVNAGLLIPGHGEPVRDATVLIDGARISYAGPAAGAPEAPGAVTRTAATVMPGMWDCHGHFMGSRAMDLARLAQEPVALRAARSAPDLANTLNAGFTSVREVGGLGVYLAQAVREGLLDGPSIYAAGAVLSTTGGHGDLHCYPLSWVEDFGHYDGTFRLADGTSECMRAVREQLRRGAAVIKVCASGGVLSRWTIPSTSSSLTPTTGESSRWPGWRTGWWRRTATASPASWPPCGPGSQRSSTGPTWMRSPATRCVKPARSWSPPGRSSRTSWPTWRRSRRTRPRS